MMKVISHFKKYGPNGVPKGLVDTQNSVNGSTPCLEKELALVSSF